MRSLGCQEKRVQSAVIKPHYMETTLSRIWGDEIDCMYFMLMISILLDTWSVSEFAFSEFIHWQSLQLYH